MQAFGQKPFIAKGAKVALRPQREAPHRQEESLTSSCAVSTDVTHAELGRDPPLFALAP